MDRQARTGDTEDIVDYGVMLVLVKREKWQVGAKHCRGGWGRKGKDDRKQNTLAPELSTAVVWDWHCRALGEGKGGGVGKDILYPETVRNILVTVALYCLQPHY